MNLRLGVTLAVLAAAAIGSWYLARLYAGDDREVVETELQYRGYYLKSARILGTGPDGALLYEIDAARAEQQADKAIEFSEVQIRYSPQSDIPWTINADVATLFPDRRRVALRGHVTAFSADGFGGDETEIRTQYLEFDPENYVAETNERVQIRIGSRSLTGTGMLASLNESRMELKSNVSGRFIP